ncbi:hypothetical protein OQA88_3102 [Cercophora sp. LCS_1]
MALPSRANSCDGILGIDFGSTSTRAAILCKDKRQELPVENISRDNLNSRFDKFDFSSAAFPFEDHLPGQPVYFIRGNAERRPISNKYCMYPLVGLKDKILTEYPLVQDLLSRKDEPAFRARMRRGLIEMFIEVVKRALVICRREKISITRVSLTTPAIWTIEFEDLYAGLICEAFRSIDSAPPITRRDIDFCLETEALAHFVFKKCADEVDPDKKYKYVLLIDFGGHNMGGCLFQIARSGEDMRFFQVAESFGEPGGSEEWEHHLGEYCAVLMKSICDGPLSPSDRQEILDNFNRKKQTMGPGFSIDVRATVSHNGRLWPLNIEPETIDQCWEKALEKPMEAATRNIRDAARQTREKGEELLVLVSGGTCRNMALQSRITALCRKEKLPPPVFTDSFENRTTHDSEKLAMGATYASMDSLTVEEFFARGAAIGLQRKQARQNPEGYWDDSAPLLYDAQRKESIRLELPAQGDRFRLICDPFFSELPTQEQTDVAFDRCYDLLSLGPVKHMGWRVELSLERVKGVTHMLIKQWSKTKSSQRRWTSADTWRIPLYFNGGNNCVLAGTREKSISCLDPDIAKHMAEEYQNGQSWVMEEERWTGASEGPCTSPQAASSRDDDDDELSDGRTVGGVHVPQRLVSHKETTGAARRAKPAGSLQQFAIDPLQNRRRRQEKGGPREQG